MLAAPMASERALDTIGVYLFVSTSDPDAAVEAVSAWVDRPPDLCVTSPSVTARETAAFACAGRYVQTFAEPLLAGRRSFEREDGFAARYAEALRTLHVFDTRAALIVCDDMVAGEEPPFVLDGDALLRRCESIERALPRP